MRGSVSIDVFLAALLVACSGEVSEPDRGGGGADAGVAASCPEQPANRGALLLDGHTGHVTMGAAPELGLATFTVEAWVRRDGRGLEAGTGEGGVRLVPIASKGRGEADGSPLDCNYAFGFAGDVLGADFEDAASGANHPVIGKTEIPVGEWHHTAVSYDGTTWRLYVDGVLDAEKEAGATPRADSIQHFAIGTTMSSTGVPAGYLEGAIDEVRVWSRARSGEEIAASMYSAVSAGDGLVSRWALDPGSAGEAPDSAGGHAGTLVGAGASFVALGAGIEGGAPPVLEPMPAVVVPGQADLSVTLANPEDHESLATVFHVRPVSRADDFTIVVLPDTQVYTIEGKGLEHFFYDQTAWVREHRKEYNIVAVIHNGDLINNGDKYVYQWQVADRAMDTLEKAEAGLADGVPYGISVGNHDLSVFGVAGKATLFNQYFGITRFGGRVYYGGNYGGSNNESWFTFNAGGLDFVVVNLQYNTAPSAATLAWARSIFEMHPHAFGILNTHYLLGSSGNFGTQGAAIYQALKDVPSVQLMTCGHVGAEARRTDVFEGHPIHTMLADYQFEAEGGGGKLRLWEFSPVRGEVTVRTYSPTRDQWYTDEHSEFTLPVDLTGAGGEWQDLVAVEDIDGRITARWTAVEPGKTYEWYATASDCAHTARTPVERFVVPSADEEPSALRQEPRRPQRAEDIRHPPLRPAGTAVPLED
ncbi:MAG TPA: LamG-like jellyroll fold domain-containing protein [Kofleriaceae bacterium]|nr:LamG-like jellyroll fold domain-containing protein [Kofleriaceae bacterium]